MISGKITCYNDSNPAILATVVIKGTFEGTYTDIDGNYQIAVDSSHTKLLFSFPTYKTQEIDIGNDSIINVTLVQEEVPILDFIDVIKVHYSKTSVAAVASIRTKKFGVFKTNKYKSRPDPIKYEVQCQILNVHKGWRNLPEYWGLLDADNLSFIKYLCDNINYPESLACNRISSKVIVRFKIDLSGNLEDIEIVKGCDELFDTEILSVFRSAPKLTDEEIKRLAPWRNQLRRVYYIGNFLLPIHFIIM